MISEFLARHRDVNSSELERLTGRGTNGVATLASACGNLVLMGRPVTTQVGGAINMLTLSIAADHGIELPIFSQWLPGLRVETLLILGHNYDNWHYEGPPEHEQSFYKAFAQARGSNRAQLAGLLGVNLFDAKAVLRFRSPTDVDFLTREDMYRTSGTQTPLVNIHASMLADRVQQVCMAPLFFSRLRSANTANF